MCHVGAPKGRASKGEGPEWWGPEGWGGGVWERRGQHFALSFLSGTISRKRCCWNSQSNFPCYDPIVQRSIQKQRTWKTVSIHFVATQETIEAVFRIIVSANQLSLNGAVEEMCEHESVHD